MYPRRFLSTLQAAVVLSLAAIVAAWGVGGATHRGSDGSPTRPGNRLAPRLRLDRLRLGMGVAGLQEQVQERERDLRLRGFGRSPVREAARGQLRGRRVPPLHRLAPV